MRTAETPSPGAAEPLLRCLEPRDGPAYAALWREGLASHGHFFRTAPEDEPSPGIPTRFAPDSFTLGAFLGDALIGITSLEREPASRLRHKALISRMFVRPEAEGSGVGKLLLREALVRAESLGDLRQVCLTVLATNERAQRLYASLGFRGYAREPAAVRIGETFVDEIQMVRFLRREPRVPA
ncbi:MAG: GNAT family N-acetyltransferase [Steroidobacteraceae bacterium]|jgi:cyclohexyl-isocyanide hydratase|nr:GNAT family N-acetyltransferase [Steroidobacteraceae bacterium]